MRVDNRDTQGKSTRSRVGDQHTLITGSIEYRMKHGTRMLYPALTRAVWTEDRLVYWQLILVFGLFISFCIFFSARTRQQKTRTFYYRLVVRIITFQI